ncbi:WD40-repeat-containing domain protein [Scleroderma yunnanense]
MVNNQPKNRLSKLKPWKTKSIQVTANPQFALVRKLSLYGNRLGKLTGKQTQESPPALAPNIPSTSCGSTNIATGKLASLKKLLRFHRPTPNIASSSIDVNPSVRAELPHALEPHDFQAGSTQVALIDEPQEPTSKEDQPVAPVTSLCDKMDAAQNELGATALVPPPAQHAVGVVGVINTTVSQIDTISSTYLQPLKSFDAVVNTMPNIHPYAQMALGVLTSAAQLIVTQANLNKSVSNLLEKIQCVYNFLLEEDTLANLDTMKDTLGSIAQVISSCAQFVKNYSEIESSWKRVGKNIASETQTAIIDYNKVLDDLMQQYRGRTVRDNINVYRILDDLNLDDMSYAGDAGLDPMKKCVDGTRSEILKEIVDWIHDPDINAPRIFWLHGQAGKGKSAIAHTIGLWFKNVGGLGSCFCFARDRQAERREEKMLLTIARDLANQDLTFRRALAAVFASNRSLMATPDIIQQWEKLLLVLLSQVSKGIGRSIVIVVDALDESGPESSRSHILSILTSPEAAKLPTNIRIFITSRPFPDIQAELSNARHVKSRSLDDVPVALTERDIRLFVSIELRDLQDIGEGEFKEIARKADGLFEWARLACVFIRSHATGQTVRDAFNNFIAHTSGQGKTLLDNMYGTILKTVVSRRPTALARFRSVMGQILYTLEPLPMDALNAMRKCFSNRKDDYNVAIVLNFLGALLSGVTDHTNPVRPLHASFYDFLTDKSWSGDYFVGKSDMHGDLALASLCVLQGGLCFNICGLESSYLLNSEVSDLAKRVKARIPLHLSYSCQFWAKHLQSAKFDTALAGHVMDILGNEKILFWFETLSLLGVLDNAAPALLSAGRWLQGKEGYENVAALAKDGVKFIHNLSNGPFASTPHLALRAKFPCIAKVAEGHHKDWPAAQVLLQGHTDHVTSVAFCSDGTRIVSGSYDRTVRIWDADRGVQICSPLKGHTHNITSVAFSPDGTRIVSGSLDNTVRIWDASKNVQIGSPLEGHTQCVTSVAFSPDGTKIVSSSFDRTVRIWDADRGVQIGSPLEGHTHCVRPVAFSPDGTRIVSGSDDKAVRIWDADRGVQIGSPLKGHTDYVTSVAFSPDGTRIVSGSFDSTVRIWDADRGVQIGSPFEGHTFYVTSVAFSPDGTRIVSGANDWTVRIWDANRGVQIGSPLEGHTFYVTSVAFSPDGTRIVSGSWDMTIRIWDADMGVQIDSPCYALTYIVTSVAFSPDGTRIVSGSNDKTVRIWDANRGVQIGSPLEGHTNYVTSVAFSSDGTRIVSGSNDRTVRIWDADRGVQIGSLLEGHAYFVTSVAFSSDGTRVVSGSWDRTVRIWDADSGVQIGNSLEGHTDYVISVAFSPDGTRIMSSSQDRTVRIWDADRGVQIGSPLEGHTNYVTSIAFSPDGKKIVSGSSDRTMRVWDADRGVQTGNPLEGHTNYITSVAFSPDGTRIVSGSNDRTVRIWDADRGVQIGNQLEGHTDYVTSVAFCPDGTKIVSGSKDRTIRVWDIRRGVRFNKVVDGNVFIRSNEGYTSSSNGEPCIYFSDNVTFNPI